MNKITAVEAARMIKGKDVVYTGGKSCKGDEIQFDANEMITVKSVTQRITDSDPIYTITELTSSDGFAVVFSEKMV